MPSFSAAAILPFAWPLLRALGATLEITAICAVAGILLGFALALAATGPSRVARWLVAAYVDVVRGLPILVILFWIFFCLPVIVRVDIGSFWSACTALSLYMGAITCETFRSSLKAVEPEQTDAAVALGLGKLQRGALVLAPQMALHAIPPLLSNLVGLFKESSLVSAVGVVQLMFVGQNVSMATGRPFEILTCVGLIYFVVGFTMTRCVSMIETRLRTAIFA